MHGGPPQGFSVERKPGGFAKTTKTLKPGDRNFKAPDAGGRPDGGPHCGHARIGLFGGSFDPIHEGHVAIAAAAKRQFGLSRVLFMVARLSPFKSGSHASAADRLAMARLACAGDESLEVSDLEILREGPSFTIDTVEQLRARAPGEELHLIVGADSLLQFPRWRRAVELLHSTPVLVAPRGGVGIDILQKLDLQQFQREAGREFEWIEMPEHPASSTDLRAALAAGERSLPGLPRGVENYILQKELYKNGARPAGGLN